MEQEQLISTAEIKRLAKKRNREIHDHYSIIVRKIVDEGRTATFEERIILDNLDREFTKNERQLMSRFNITTNVE